jgi:hypothetical protein
MAIVAWVVQGLIVLCDVWEAGYERPLPEFRFMALFRAGSCNHGENGAHGRIRTSDRLVRSQVLYPTELHARVAGIVEGVDYGEFGCIRQSPKANFLLVLRTGLSGHGWW